MKRLALFCGAMLLFAGIASAQDTPKAEAFGGYSYLHVSDQGATASFNGGSGSLSYNLAPWLGMVGDFGGYHWSNSGSDANVVSYLFGPKFAYRKGPITPFAQVLFGGARASGNIFNLCASARVRRETSCSASGSENAFAMAFGGGLDWNATPHLGIRLIQAEYLLTKFSDGANDRQNNARISTGVVIRW